MKQVVVEGGCWFYRVWESRSGPADVFGRQQGRRGPVRRLVHIRIRDAAGAQRPHAHQFAWFEASEMVPDCRRIFGRMLGDRAAVATNIANIIYGL
jgi:hypothetical protein